MLKEDALSHYGTIYKVSGALTEAGYRTTPQAVSNWGLVVPEVSARRLAEITAGVIPLRIEDYRKEVNDG